MRTTASAMEEPRKSICYMSLADAFLTRLRRDAESRSKNRMMKGVTLEVLPVTQDRQDFIYDHLTTLYHQKRGTFSKPKMFSRQTIYECERSTPCKGSSTGDPTKTRANGCSAYVSFLFEEGATITACIIRSRLTHTGHDPTNREESRVSRIDLSLRFLIESQLNGGRRVSEVMSEIAKWNRDRRNTDHRNRRYFPTRQDIQQLALTLRKPPGPPRSSSGSRHPPRKPRKYDTQDRDSAARILRTELRDWCVFHQSRTTAGPSPRPLILVLQSEAMRERLERHGRHVVYIEKNYDGLRQYGNAVYVLAVRDEGGGSHAAAYVITSDDSAVTFVTALQQLNTRCPLNPRVLLLDHEIHSFSQALATLYPKTQFLIPWFQVAQEVHGWLLSSQVAGQENATVRRVLLHFLQELKAHCTEEEFLLSAETLHQRVEFSAFTSMMQTNWLSCHAKWSDHGRAGVCGSATQSVIWERFFLRLHHQFLKGLHTRKTLPGLLTLITKNITQQKHVVDDLVNMSLIQEECAQEQAAALLKQGWGQLVTWQGDWVAHVPCHTVLETSYRVNLVSMECECAALAVTGPCLHLCLVETLVQQRQGPTAAQERHRIASDAYHNSDYLLEAGCCIMFHSGAVCVTELVSRCCTCVASTYLSDCVGALLIGMVEGTGETQHRDLMLATPQSEDLQGSQQPSIVIQTHTGLMSPRLPQEVISVSGVPDTETQVLVVEGEGEDGTHVTLPVPGSTQTLIEKLYSWSRSPEFFDSDVLNGLLQAAHDSIWPAQPCPAPFPRPAEKAQGNKKLRAVVRPVKREWELLKREEEEEEEKVFVGCPAKVTRSGRTIKVKEEPDFVM